MTREQCEVLRKNAEHSGQGVYHIVEVKYPARPYNWRASDGTCLKISTEVFDPGNGLTQRYSDWYSEDGRTVDSQQVIV